MPRYAALLRGMNIGDRRMKMADLRAAVEGAGFADVATLLQSGNVVFSADEEDEQALRSRLEQAIEIAAGFASPVVLRTRDELAGVLERNPLADVADDPRRYQVTFLSAPLPADAVAEIEALDAAPEAIAVAGREIYTWHPGGIGRSPLWGRLSKLPRQGALGTSRNWATVEKLLALG